jgi:DNA-binding response OmpR family regulator
MRVLIVEDEERLAATIARGLRREGMAVDIALDGVTAIEKADTNPYDVIVLDRDLPEMHGDDVCRILVEEGAGVRVLMLTASGEISDRVEGLSIGADDYLGKPFAFEELVARACASPDGPDQPCRPCREQRDIAGRSPHCDGPTRHSLTRKEFAVLRELLARTARWCRTRTSSSACGTSTPTVSATLSG